VSTIKFKLSQLLILLMVFTFACKSKKNIIANINIEKNNSVENNKKAIFENIKLQQSTYNYISCKGECEYNDGKNTYNFDIQLEMEKDNFIFVKATYLLGIEVARMYITPEQIQIINHFEKTNTLAKYDYLKKYSSANLAFKNIENLILGNAIFNQSETNSTLDSSETKYIVKTILETTLQQSEYNKIKIFKIESNILEDMVKNQVFDLKYGQYTENGTDFYPTEIAINIRAEKNLGCNMKLYNFAYVKKKDPLIRVPASYKTINY